MGRGKQKGLGGFDALFGARRGQYASTRFLRLDTKRPSAAQEQQVQALIEEAFEKADLEPLFEELKACRGVSADEAPLLALVLDGVAGSLASHSEDWWRATVRNVADAVGVRSEKRSATLITTRRGQAIHIWPEGREHLNELGIEGRTLCNRPFKLHWMDGWSRAPRGAFMQKKPSSDQVKGCTRCAHRAALLSKDLPEGESIYPEAIENAYNENLFWPEGQALYQKTLRELLRERLVSTSYEDTAPELAHEITKEALQRTLLAETLRDPVVVIYNALRWVSLGSKTKLQEDLGIKEASPPSYAWERTDIFVPPSIAFESYMASWFDEGDWKDLFRALVEPLEPGTWKTVNPEQSGRWSDLLLGRIRELGAERGFPRSETLILAR